MSESVSHLFGRRAHAGGFLVSRELTAFLHGLFPLACALDPFLVMASVSFVSERINAADRVLSSLFFYVCGTALRLLCCDLSVQTALAAVGCMATWSEIYKELSAADAQASLAWNASWSRECGLSYRFEQAYRRGCFAPAP